MDDWGPNGDYRSYLTGINHFIGQLRAPPCAFGLFQFIFGPEEGSNQMGKQKKKNNFSFIWVWIQLRLSNTK